MFAKIIAHVLQLALGACARGQGLGNLSLSGGFRRLLQLVARLLQLLALFGHLRLVLRPIHPLLQLVRVGQHLFLLFLQSLEFAANLLPFLFIARFLQRGLEFLELLIDVLLTAGEFLEPIHDLNLLALSRVLG